jgi:hypothetical protein
MADRWELGYEKEKFEWVGGIFDKYELASEVF